jgi:predicted RNase H-like HicB family nuclease
VCEDGETEHCAFSLCALATPIMVWMLKIGLERAEDGRWIADVPALPGVLAYGDTEAEARARAVSPALRVIADRIDNGEPLPEEAGNLFAA